MWISLPTPHLLLPRVLPPPQFPTTTVRLPVACLIAPLHLHCPFVRSCPFTHTPPAVVTYSPFLNSCLITHLFDSPSHLYARLIPSQPTRSLTVLFEPWWCNPVLSTIWARGPSSLLSFLYHEDLPPCLASFTRAARLHLLLDSTRPARFRSGGLACPGVCTFPQLTFEPASSSFYLC